METDQAGETSSSSLPPTWKVPSGLLSQAVVVLMQVLSFSALLEETRRWHMIKSASLRGAPRCSVREHTSPISLTRLMYEVRANHQPEKKTSQLTELLPQPCVIGHKQLFHIDISKVREANAFILSYGSANWSHTNDTCILKLHFIADSFMTSDVSLL